MRCSFLDIQEDLEPDNGHLLVLVQSKSGLLSVNEKSTSPVSENHNKMAT